MVTTRIKTVVITQKNIIIRLKHTNTKRLQNTQAKEQDKQQGTVYLQASQKTIMATVSPYLSIITLKVNELNCLIKRYSIAECIKKIKIQQYAAYKTHFSSKDMHRE